MLNFSRLKAGAVLCVCLIGIMLGIPSLISTGHLPAWYPQSHVNLGLDLNGGSYLLLEGDTADLAKTRIEAMRDSVSGAMRNGTPRIEIGDISTRGGNSPSLSASHLRLPSLASVCRRLPALRLE
jgi:preprotein translocase subunit SecD